MYTKDRDDWLKGAKFLITALHKSHWPGPIPDAEEVIGYVGKIAANNFGIYSHQTKRIAAHSLQATSCTLNVSCSNGDALQSCCDTAERSLERSETAASPCSPGLNRNAEGVLAHAAADDSSGPQQQQQQLVSASARAWPLIDDLALQLQTVTLASNQPPVDSHDNGSRDAATASDTLTDTPWNSAPSTCEAVGTRNDHAAIVSVSPADAPGLDPCVTEVKHMDESGQHSTSSTEQIAEAPTVRISAADMGTKVANKPPRGPREEAVGRELYITASYFNHSCDPNCMMMAGVGLVTAQQEIKVRTNKAYQNISVVSVVGSFDFMGDAKTLFHVPGDDQLTCY